MNNDESSTINQEPLPTSPGGPPAAVPSQPSERIAGSSSIAAIRKDRRQQFHRSHPRESPAATSSTSAQPAPMEQIAALLRSEQGQPFRAKASLPLPEKAGLVPVKPSPGRGGFGRGRTPPWRRRGRGGSKTPDGVNRNKIIPPAATPSAGRNAATPH